MSDVMRLKSHLETLTRSGKYNRVELNFSRNSIILASRVHVSMFVPEKINLHVNHVSPVLFDVFDGCVVARVWIRHGVGDVLRATFLVYFGQVGTRVIKLLDLRGINFPELPTRACSGRAG